MATTETEVKNDINTYLRWFKDDLEKQGFRGCSTDIIEIWESWKKKNHFEQIDFFTGDSYEYF